MTVSMNIVACFLALFFASSAVSSRPVLLEEDDGHQDFRPAHSLHDTLAIENMVVDSQYKSQSYHVDDYNGLGFTHDLVTPKRLKGTARKLAVMSETRNEEQITEKNSNSLDNAVQNGGLPAKNAVNKKRDSKKIKHLPSSSGMETSLSINQENQLVSRDQKDGFRFQKKARKTPLASSVRSLGERSKQDAFSTKEAALKRDEASFQGAKTPSTPHPQESQNYSMSRSTTYGSNETDLSDIVDMDYNRVRRNPPIHNSFSP